MALARGDGRHARLVRGLGRAQFEREVTGERIRDKIAASKKKGLWVGGAVPLGYRVKDRKLIGAARPRLCQPVRLFVDMARRKVI